MLSRAPDEPWPAFLRRAFLLLAPLIAAWLLLQMWNLAHDARAHQRARASIHDGYVRALQRCAADRPLQWDRCQAAAEASRRAALQLAELRYKGTVTPDAATALAAQDGATAAAAGAAGDGLQPVSYRAEPAAAGSRPGAALATAWAPQP